MRWTLDDRLNIISRLCDYFLDNRRYNEETHELLMSVITICDESRDFLEKHTPQVLQWLDTIEE